VSGEHVEELIGDDLTAGSSPRERGALAVDESAGGVERIIPA